MLNRFSIFVLCFQELTAVLLDWIKFDVWNQVVLVSCCSRVTVEPAWNGSSTTFETGLSEAFDSISRATRYPVKQASVARNINECSKLVSKRLP